MIDFTFDISRGEYGIEGVKDTYTHSGFSNSRIEKVVLSDTSGCKITRFYTIVQIILKMK